MAFGGDWLLAVDPGPFLARAALVAGETVKTAWILAAQRAGLHDRGSYIAGIQAAAVVVGELSEHGDIWEVITTITNDSDHAGFVENGHPAYRLSERINWSGPKVRTSAAGRPYLRIPFRSYAHQDQGAQAASGMTPTAQRAMMPRDIYARARALDPTIQGLVPGSRTRTITSWGGRLSTGPATLTSRPRDARVIGTASDGSPIINSRWKSSQYEGMFRSPMKGGGSSYHTIRTITPDSTGWGIPAVAGRHVAENLAQLLPSDAGLAALLVDVLQGAVLF